MNKEVDYTHPNFCIPPKRKYRTNNWTNTLHLGENKIDEHTKSRKEFYLSTGKPRRKSNRSLYSE